MKQRLGTWRRQECSTGKSCAGVRRIDASRLLVRGYMITDPSLMDPDIPPGEIDIVVPSSLFPEV